jgi:P27 family predicted phage terminase small subunit
MAGRPTKPTALKLVEGNRGKRAAPSQEPDPDYLADLTAPSHLTPAARDVWDQLAPQLRRSRLLTVVDVPMLEAGCEAIAQFRHATRKAAEQPVYGKVVASDADGQPRERAEQINPWLIVQSMAFKQSMAVLREFGMSPAARARVAVNPQAELFPAEDRAAGYF